MTPDEKLELILQMDKKVTSLLDLKSRLDDGHPLHVEIDDIVGRLLRHISRVRAAEEVA